MKIASSTSTSSLIPLKFIDLFSGAGGLSCGLEQAGHICKLGVDIDQHALNTFSQNHHSSKIFCGPIQELTNKKLGELVDNEDIHMVVGGPPCQGFSTAGLGNPEDERNTLFQQYIRIVKHLRPLFLIMENVTGLVAKKNQGILEIIFKDLIKLGYHLEFQVLDASSYSVPEKRKRTIIFGTRLPLCLKFPDPHKKVLTVNEAFQDLQSYQKKKGNIENHDILSAQIKNTMDKKRIHHIPPGKGIRYEKDVKMYLPKALWPDVDWKTLPEGRFRQTKYQRLDPHRPSPTIMTHRHTYFHPAEDRYLTVREAACLQSFPMDFIFSGPLSKQWKQVGNAVPPKLAKALGLEINHLLTELVAHKYKKSNNSKKSINQALDLLMKSENIPLKERAQYKRETEEIGKKGEKKKSSLNKILHQSLKNTRGHAFKYQISTKELPADQTL